MAKAGMADNKQQNNMRKMKTSQGNSTNSRYKKKSQKQNGKKVYRGQGK